MCYNHQPCQQSPHAGGASEKERGLMLKEILILTISVLPNWLVLVVMLLDRHERMKNKRADDAVK